MAIAYILIVMRLRHILLLFLLGLSTLFASAQPDLFWVGYRKYIYRNNNQPLLTYLTQINVYGQVILPPRHVAPELRQGFGLDLCMSFGAPGQLNLWTNGRGLARSSLSLRTLETVSFSRVNANKNLIGSSYLVMTHRSENNFMLFHGPDASVDNIVANSLTSTGTLTGKTWTIAPQNESGHYAVGLSSDGGCVVWGGRRIIQVQALDNAGNPIHKVVTIYKGKYYESAASVAVTNVLPENRRFVIFSTNDEHFSCGSENVFSLIVVNAKTGEKIETAFHRTEPTEDCNGGPHVAIDAKGRFFLYGDEKYRRASFSLNYPILFQALDVQGHRSGNPIPIAQQVNGGFDLLAIN